MLFRCHRRRNATAGGGHGSRGLPGRLDAGSIQIVQSETTIEAVDRSEIDARVDGFGSMRRAEACVVPEGKCGSYGHRALLSLQLGCVPLRTKERFSYEFFHEAIDWSALSVRRAAESNSALPYLPAPLSTLPCPLGRT